MKDNRGCIGTKGWSVIGDGNGGELERKVEVKEEGTKTKDGEKQEQMDGGKKKR